jgi:hypothetical protein
LPRATIWVAQKFLVRRNIFGNTYKIRFDLQKAVYSLYSVLKEYNLEIATKKTKVFGFNGADHLRTKIIIKHKTLEQVNQFTYLGCNIN